LIVFFSHHTLKTDSHSSELSHPLESDLVCGTLILFGCAPKGSLLCPPSISLRPATWSGG
ncbi:MAG: hypothetical protein KC588_19555, partial [Nitrospira sp.]|nr:hypothetical protein [Nitrospira sp.]